MTLLNTYRSLLFAIYAPSLLISVGSQGLVVLLPLYILDLTGSPAAAATVVGARGIGTWLSNLPLGVLVARYGDKQVMQLACVVLTLCTVAFALTASVTVFAAIAVVYGMAASGWLLGRISYITDACDDAVRGRVISVLAGIMRAGMLLGPLAGGLVAEFLGYRYVFIGAGVLTLLGAALVWRHAEDVRPERDQSTTFVHRIGALFRQHRRSLLTAGSCALVLMFLRAARPVLIPVFGDAAGLGAAAIGVIYSLSASIDMALFYPAGQIMDARGRKFTLIPALTLFVLAYALLPLADGFYSLLVVAMLIGTANGLSTGAVMTMGSDLAPKSSRGEFLGMWRMFSDSGTALGPLFVAAVVNAATLGAAALAVGGVGAVGLVVTLLFVEETLKTLPRDRNPAPPDS
ncbi:MAG: MFS transporter [Gammaproteobacteria bacterium]|nr:MFS transporter [Gammaproteobacteria bacterium]